MSNSVAVLNQQMVSEIDSLADFWKTAADATPDPRQPAKKKRAPRRRGKTPAPIAQ